MERLGKDRKSRKKKPKRKRKGKDRQTYIHADRQAKDINMIRE